MSKLVLKNLTQELEDNRKNIYSDIMEQIKELDVLENVM
jgi:hypothetical protein